MISNKKEEKIVYESAAVFHIIEINLESQRTPLHLPELYKQNEIEEAELKNVSAH